MASNFDLLGKDSDLKISTKIKDGNFHNRQTNLSFSKLYSQIDYDSSNGVRDGFATIKINDIPLKFDIKKEEENGYFNTQLVTEETVSAKKIQELATEKIKKTANEGKSNNIIFVPFVAKLRLLKGQ